MELFLIYVITRLSDFKDGLFWISIASGIMLLVVAATRLINEVATDTNVKEKVAAHLADKSQYATEVSVYFYLGIQRVTKRSLWLFTPVFLLAFCINLLLPTTRDAVVIAGGYGLVEAVKNERVQRMFAKSAKVASQWLDDQLNGDDTKTSSDPEKAASAVPLAASAPQ